MFTGILRHIQTNKVRSGIIIGFWERKLGVNKPNTEFARSSKAFERISALEYKVHAFSMVEIGQESHQLYDFLLLNDLNASQTRFPLFVDRDYHSAPGYHKRGSNANIGSEYGQLAIW
jgi:hypothetical protein